MGDYKDFELILRSTDRAIGDTNDYQIQIGQFLPIYEQEFECRFMGIQFVSATRPQDGAGDDCLCVDVSVSFKAARGYDSCGQAPQSVVFVDTPTAEYAKKGAKFRIGNLNGQLADVRLTTISKAPLTDVPEHVLVFHIKPLHNIKK